MGSNFVGQRQPDTFAGTVAEHVGGKITMWDVYIQSDGIGKAFDGRDWVSFHTEDELEQWLSEREILMWKAYDAN
jgi:hypothetical protein